MHYLYQNTSHNNKGRAKQAGSIRPKCAIRWEDKVAGNERERKRERRSEGSESFFERYGKAREGL